MAFCGKCGNQLEEGAKFCPKCGTPVIDKTTGTANDTNTVSGQKQSDFLLRTAKTVAFIIPWVIAFFLVTYNFVPSLHCKLFSWFPFFESPSVVAYKYINCVKDGNTVEMMDYTYTNGYPSRTKMKKRMEELQTKGSRSDKESFETVSKMLLLGIALDGGIKEFSIVKQEIWDNSAHVEYEVTRKSGMKETKTLHLRKDEDGKWAIHLTDDK